VPCTIFITKKKKVPKSAQARFSAIVDYCRSNDRIACRVDPGGCPPGPPTDPDVQNSRIRLFRHMGLLRAGKPSKTLPRFSALAIFPSIGSMPRRPLPSSGSLRVWFPGLIGTMGRSDFLPSIPGGSLTRPPVPSSRSLFRSRRRRALPTTGQGFGLPASPTGLSRTETTGSPEFPSDPLDTCPAHIRPRRDRSARPFSARDIAFRSWHGVGSHE